MRTGQSVGSLHAEEVDVVGIDDDGGAGRVKPELVEDNLGRRPGADHDDVEVPCGQ